MTGMCPGCGSGYHAPYEVQAREGGRSIIIKYYCGDCHTKWEER